jgi:hypothetical protein
MSIYRYEVLPNLTDPQPGHDIPNLVNNNKSEVKTRGVQRKIKKKSIIIGDSHAKECGQDNT